MTETQRKKTLLAFTMSDAKATRLEISHLLRRPLTIKQRLLTLAFRRAI